MVYGCRLTYVWGQAAATSLTYLLIFTFNAYAMYLFAYDQTRSQAGAWIAGLIFGFFPTTLSDGGHINMLPGRLAAPGTVCILTA